MQRVKSIGEISSRLNLILQKANEEEKKVQATYDSDVSRRTEKVEGLRNRLTDFGLSVDQVRFATMDPFQGPESGGVTGRSTINDPLSARFDSDDKLAKLLRSLNITDSQTLAKKSIEEIAQRVSLSLKPTIGTQQFTSNTGFGQTISPSTNYLPAQNSLSSAQPIRLSGTSQRASSVGVNQLGGALQYSSVPARAVPTLNTAQITTTPSVIDGRQYGTALSSRATISGYPVQNQQQTLIQSSSTHYATRPSNTVQRQVQYTTGGSPLTTYQPTQTFGTSTYQPLSGISNYPIRHESSVIHPISNFTSALQPSSSIRPISNIPTNLPTVSQPYLTQNISRTYQPSLQTTTYGQLAPIKPTQITIPVSTISAQTTQRESMDHYARSLTDRPITYTQDKTADLVKEAVEKEAREEQIKLGVMSREYESKLDRVHKDDVKLEHDLQDVIHKLTLAKGSVENQLEEINKRYAALETEFSLYKNTIGPQSSDTKTQIDEILKQLSEERKETVKMRDTILEQGDLIESLKTDVSKRESRLKDLEDDIKTKNTELSQYKVMVEETTNNLKKHLDENRDLKQQTLIQEYQTKEIVSQSNNEIHNLVQKMHVLESEILKLNGHPEDAESPVHREISDKTLQNRDFHIQAMSTVVPKEGTDGQGRTSEPKSKSSTLSESEIINNLANFLASPSQGHSRVSSDPKAHLTEEQRQHLASMLKDPEVNNAFGSMISAHLSAHTQRLKVLEQENQILRAQTMAPHSHELTSPELSGLKPIADHSEAQGAQEGGRPAQATGSSLRMQESEVINSTSDADFRKEEERKHLLESVDALNVKLQELESKAQSDLAKEKANTESYLQKISTLTEQLNLSQVHPQAPSSPVHPEKLELIKDIEVMEQQAGALHQLVGTQPGTNATREQAQRMLDQIGTFCNKLADKKGGNERKDIEKIAFLAMKVNQSHFQLNTIDELAKGITDYRQKASAITFGNQSATFGSDLGQSTHSQADKEQGKLIEGLKHAIFELDQSKAGLLQQNGLLQNQIAHLTDRLREAETHVTRGSHIPQGSKKSTGDSPTQSPVEQEKVKAYMTQISQLTNKIHKLEVSINLKRMTDHILRASRARHHKGEHHQTASSLSQISSIASGLEQSPQASKNVKDYLNRISLLAKNLSSRKVEDASNSSVEGSPINKQDSVEIEEIQALITKVHDVHLAEPAELSAHHPEAEHSQVEEIVKLQQSISGLEELVTKRENELKSSHDEVSALSRKIIEFEGQVKQSNVTTAQQIQPQVTEGELDQLRKDSKELSQLRKEVFDLSQNRAGLHQENDQLQKQIGHLLERVKEAEGQVNLVRQQTGVSSKYHDETISQSGMVRELRDSQVSTLSGENFQIPGHQVIGGESDKTKGLLANVAALTLRINEYEATLKAKEDALLSFKNQNTGLQQEITKLSTEVNSLRASERSIQTTSKAEVDKLSENINLLTADIAKLNGQNKELKDRETSLLKQIEEIKAQMVKIGDLKTQEAQLASQKQQLENERIKLEREKKEIVNLQNQVLDKNEQRLRKFSEQGGTSEQDPIARIEKLEKDLKDAKEEKSKLTSILKDLEATKKIADIEAMENKKQREKFEKTLKDKIDAITKENGDFKADIKKRDDKIDKLETELYKIRTENKSLLEEVKNKKAEITKLSQSLVVSASVVAESQVTDSQVQAKSESKPSTTSKPAPAHKEDPKASTSTHQKASKDDVQYVKKQEKETVKPKETHQATHSQASPDKTQVSQPAKEEIKQSTPSHAQNSKKADNRKQSHNDGGSWMEGFSEDEDSEDPDKLFGSYVAPPSLTVQKEQKDEGRKTDSRSHQKESSHRAEDTGRATRGGVTDSHAVTESQTTKRSKISQQTESRGGKSKKSKGRYYEEDNDDEYYVKKDSKVNRETEEYREKDAAHKDQRGSKTKRDEVSPDTDRNLGSISSPNRFGQDKDASERFNPIKPTYVESEFVEKKSKATHQGNTNTEKQALHYSVKETIIQRSPQADKDIVSKSQQNPITNTYTSPLLRAEDFVDYQEEGDRLIKVSDYSMSSFEVEDPEADQMRVILAEVSEMTIPSDKKSETVGKASQEAASGEGKKKKKKKGTAGDSEKMSMEKNWLKLMGKQ